MLDEIRERSAYKVSNFTTWSRKIYKSMMPLVDETWAERESSLEPFYSSKEQTNNMIDR